MATIKESFGRRDVMVSALAQCLLQAEASSQTLR
jgi:hypothetical protein